MSQENVDVAFRAVQAFQRGDDVEVFLVYVDPDAEWHSRLGGIEGALRGHDGVREWWKNLFAVFPDWRPTVVEVRDLGDFVLFHLQVAASGVGSGVGVDEDFWQAAEFRAGRIVWYAALRTEQEALEAVGSRE